MRQVHAGGEYVARRECGAAGDAGSLPEAGDDCCTPRDRILEQCQKEAKEKDLVHDLRKPFAHVRTAERQLECCPSKLDRSQDTKRVEREAPQARLPSGRAGLKLRHNLIKHVGRLCLRGGNEH